MHGKHNKFKTFAPMWSEEFELLNGSNSVSDIQKYFQYVLKKALSNSSIRIHINQEKIGLCLSKRQYIVMNF